MNANVEKLRIYKCHHCTDWFVWSPDFLLEFRTFADAIRCATTGPRRLG